MKKCECGEEFDEKKIWEARINSETIYIMPGDKCQYCSVKCLVDNLFHICPICLKLVFPGEYIETKKGRKGRTICKHKTDDSEREILVVEAGPVYVN